MSERLRFIWNDFLIKKLLRLSGLVFFLFIVIFILKFNDLPPQLPLFYSLPRGNEQLGNPILLLLLPILSVLVLLINTVISLFIYKREKLLARIIMTLGCFTILAMFITFVKIIFAIS